MIDWVSYIGPTIFVLALLLGTLFLISRLNRGHGGPEGQHFKVTRLHSFGPRQQIVVVEYQEECYLLGVTQHNITPLAQFRRKDQVLTPAGEDPAG